MRRFVVICALVLGAAYVIGVPAFLQRDDDPLPSNADAVVVLSGSQRSLPAGQALVDGGLAPRLVVTSDRSGRDDRRIHLCASSPKDVTCIDAGPYSTLGEARVIAGLAQKNHWDTIILVTSGYSMFRANRIFQRCVDARIVEDRVDEPWWRNVIAVPLEWIKLGISETVRRSC